MRIAIDIRKIGSRSTGDEVYTFYLIKELMRLTEAKKHDFLLLTDKPEKNIKKILSPLPENFKIFQIKPRAKIFWTFFSLPRFLKKNPVDVLHVQYIAPFFLDRKIKIITTIHDVSFRANPKWIRKKDSLFLNSLIPLTLKRADLVVTVSNFSKNEIIKFYKFPTEKIFVTNPAVDLRLFKVEKEEQKKDKIQAILGGKFPYILHLSSMQPRKNVPLIIKAFTLLKEKNNFKNLKLVLVGGKNGYNYDKKIDEILENSPVKKDIIFTGYISENDLPDFYRKSSLFVFPSSYEGFGIPLLEAMANGAPIISSDIPSFLEIDGGKNIITKINIDKKEPETARELSREIENILENSKAREEKIAKGLERVKEFTWENLAKKTLEVYEKFE